MLNTKERELLNRVQDKEREANGKFIRKMIIESEAKVQIIAKLYKLVSDVAATHGISYEDAVEILRGYVNE